MKMLKLVFLALLCCTNVEAEVLWPVTLPSRIVQQAGLSWAKGYFLPRSPYLLVFGEYDPISESHMMWIFKRQNGHYRLWLERLVEVGWDNAALDYFPLEPGSTTRVALGKSGNTLTALLFTGGLREAPQALQIYAGPEATPWAVPGYQLNLYKGRLVIQPCDDTPDGSRLGKPECEWTGSGWRSL